MAWRLEKSVEHGEIDNTVAGTTTGRIWLRGMPEPLLLSLTGDCWRDLAGTRLAFTNPAVQNGQDLAALDPDQVGLVGDITAARRICKPTRCLDAPPSWENRLYLEWFSEANGRVLIEAANFKLRISPHQWHMDEDEEEAQKLANLQAMRDFMARVIHQSHAEPAQTSSRVGNTDVLTQQADRANRAFGEVLEKYGADPDCERKEAFVMGWDRKLEALADLDEAIDGRDQPWLTDDDDDGSWNHLMDLCEEHFGDGEGESRGGTEGFADEEPVVEKSRELCLLAMHLIDQHAMPGTPAYVVIGSLLEISSKLTGAIDAGHDAPSEKTYVLTMLKRCLALANAAIGAMQQLIEHENNEDQLDGLHCLLTSIFEVREDITELHREIREEM